MPISEHDQKILRTAKARFKQEQEATSKQRQRVREDIQFYDGDQWSPEQRAAREGQQGSNGMPPVPARPTFTINKVRGPVHQVVNQERQSDFGVELVAADDFGELGVDSDETEVEVREGLARRIQRSSEAADARSWAFSRSVIAGEGYYGIYTRFVPGKSWDKEVYVRRFYNQFSVSLDPAHEMPDGSDAEWAFIGTDMPWDEYKAQFPKNAKREKNRIVDADDAAFRAFCDDEPGWFTVSADKKTRMCRVVEYFYTERVARTLVQLSDGTAAWLDELPPDIPDSVITDERDVTQKQIKWCKIDGEQILEETDWEGPDLPIIKVLGEELHPYDAERRAEGIVRPARSSGEGFNAMVSKLVETIGLAPIAPWQATPEQVAGFEGSYQLSSTRAVPVLFYNGVNDTTGAPLEKPTRTPMTSDVKAIAGALQMFDEALQSTTEVPESRTGQNTDSHLKSGKAILALQQQSEQGTSAYLDNLKRSIRYEGQVINNLLYPIYGKRPGRLTKIVTGEGDTETVMIGQPTTAPAPGAKQPPKQYTLTQDANFNVVVKVTREFDTRRDEESTIIGNLLNANPMFMTWFGDLFFKNQDGPGHAEMAKRAEVMLDPKIQQMKMAEQQSQGAVPPEVASMLAAKDGQIQHAEAAMQQLKQQLDSKTAETQAKTASDEKIAQMDNESKERIAAADREVKLGVAELGAKVDRLELFMQESQLVGARAHEAALSAADAGHEAAMSQMEHQQGLEAGAQGHAQSLEQGQQAAALAPQPAAPDENA